MPLIELQRRLTLVGAIRAGGEKQPRSPGKKLEAFRLTSARHQLIEQAAELYGGEVSPWESPTGKEWQVYTAAEELPVLVMPSYSLRQTYELWEGATRRLRLCDGVDEEMTGGPCICNAEGVDRCDIYTRLVVALPELDTVLGWRLITRGANAAHELPTLLAMMEAKGGTFVPARLRLDQRRGVKDGQVVRYVVPTLDLGVGYLALAGAVPANGMRELLASNDDYTPAPARATATVTEALSGGDPTVQGKAAPYGPAPWVHPDDPPPSPQAADVVPEPSPPAASATPQQEQTRLATDAQKRKLNVLVGKLRGDGHIETGSLYTAIGGLRGQAPGLLALDLEAYDQQGVLHWSPLRDSLTRPEASQLLDWLTIKEGRVYGTAPRTGAETASNTGGTEDAQPQTPPIADPPQDG